MNILVVGSGGVGGFFGALLHASGADVRFLARGSHLEAIRKSGLRVETPSTQFFIPSANVSDSVTGFPPADVVLFCVKCYDTETAARQIAPALTAETVIISLQNGLENESLIERTIGTGRTFGGVSYVSAAIASPGAIAESGGPRKIVFGPREGSIDERSKDMLNAFLAAGIQAELSEHIDTELWRKFVFITAVGGLTAMSRLSLGEIIKTEESRTLLLNAMRETHAVAHASNISLPNDLPERFMETISKFKPDTYSSMHHDVTHGKPLEIDALSGTVVRLGAQCNIPTPIHATMFASLLPYHRKHLYERQ